MLLATICMKRGDQNVCQQKCMQILKINPNNVQASLLLSECLLATTDNQASAEQSLSQILAENPNNYAVLSKLITFHRNAGDVDQAEKYIKRSKSMVMNVNDTGLSYCEGLFMKYKMKPNEAL